MNVKERNNADAMETDYELARRAAAALRARLRLSSQAVRILVHDGWVTLEGDVEWGYQKRRTQKAARELRRAHGVCGVTDATRLKSRPSIEEIRDRVEKGLARSARLRATTRAANTGVEKARKRLRSWAASEGAHG